MNRFPNILGEILNIEEEDNDDLDVLYATTRRSERFSQGRIRRHRGSILGHKMVNRDRVEGHERLYRDYFATPCVYESFIRRRFRMIRSLFLRIVNEVEQYDPYFIQRTDVIGVTPQSRGSVDNLSTCGIVVDVGSPDTTHENRAESPLDRELYPRYITRPKHQYHEYKRPLGPIHNTHLYIPTI